MKKLRVEAVAGGYQVFNSKGEPETEVLTKSMAFYEKQKLQNPQKKESKTPSIDRKKPYQIESDVRSGWFVKFNKGKQTVKRTKGPYKNIPILEG